MTWPVNFGGLAGGNQPLSDFDLMFAQTAAMIAIPSSAAGGSNTISLTPLVNCPILTAYSEFCGARFRAFTNSTGAVTAQFNNLGFLPVYRQDGVTQAGANDVVLGQEYVIRFSQSLNSGAGGWFLESPAIPNTSVNFFTPGGRLTLQSAVPVMTTNQIAPQTIYYAPYVHPFVPIFNGGTTQMYQFTSSQLDQVGLSIAMGGSANWPAGTPFDVYVTLVGQVVTLCTVPWTNNTTRATNLSIWNGMLTNATGIAAARVSAVATIAIFANQATFLGTFYTNGGVAGQSAWIFGTPASGGGLASFLMCNYYNKVQFNTIVTDNGAPYTYTTATPRSARGANGTIAYIQSDSERAATFTYQASESITGNAGSAVFVGIGVASSAFNTLNSFSNPATGVMTVNSSVPYQVTNSGFQTIFPLEQGDGAHANTFNSASNNQLFGQIWL